MKKLIYLFVFVISILAVKAQTNIPFVGMAGEIVSFPTGSGPYTATINVTDFSGKFNGNSVQVGHVIWRGCGRYVITAVNTQFPGEINVTFSDPDGNLNPGLGFCAILNETDVAVNGHFIASGGEFSLQTENQCMHSYYAEEEIGGGGGLDSLTNIAGDTIRNGDVIVSASDSTINYVTPTQLSDSLNAILITGSGLVEVTGSYPSWNINVDPIGTDSVYRYPVSSANITGWVEADGLGVTFTEGNQGELIVSIPDTVEINEMNFVFPASFTNANAIYVLFDYEGLRNFNTTQFDLKVPVVRLENASVIVTPNRTTPDFSDGANTSKAGKYGVSARGGGDGSDLEIAVLDAAQASNTFVNFKF